MGWAARAKQQRGNPAHEPLRRQVIIPTPTPGIADARKLRLIELSDRAYVMDARGCVRRVPASVMAELARRKAAEAMPTVIGA